MSAPDGHWEQVYRARRADETSWFRPHLDESLRLIDGLALEPAADAVIDVGGGRSTLADDLLARGFAEVTVLDLSSSALAESRDRLGDRAAAVTWLHNDVTRAGLPPAHYALWHDRAVFHFLVDAGDRARYVDTAARAVRAGGHAIIAAFAPDGPEKCSGLPVHRYDARSLAAVFAPTFALVVDSREIHPTPFGAEQAFTYVVLRRSAREAASVPPEQM